MIAANQSFPPPDELRSALELVNRQIPELRHGSLTIVVQDGHIRFVERNDSLRIDPRRPQRFNRIPS